LLIGVKGCYFAIENSRHIDNLIKIQTILFSSKRFIFEFGDCNLVIHSFNETLKNDSNSFEYWFCIGKDFQNVKNYADAVTAFEKAIRLGPRSQEALHNQGICYIHLAKHWDALRNHEKILTINPKFVFNPIYAEAFDIQGKALLKIKKFQEAINASNTAKKIDPSYKIPPDFSEAWNNIGLNFLQKGEFEDAIRACDKALGIDLSFSINPRYAVAWNNRGSHYLITGQITETLQNFDKALNIYPDYTICKSNRDVAYRKLRASIEKRQLQEKVQVPQPIHSDKTSSFSTKNQETPNSNHRSNTYVNTRNFPPKLEYKQMKEILLLLSNYYRNLKALEFLAATERIISIHSNEFMLWNINCFALSRIGRFHEAIESLRQSFNIINKNPEQNKAEICKEWMMICAKMVAADQENAFLWYCKGMLMNQSKYFDTAIDAFDHAITLDPNFSWLWDMKADTLSETGKNSQAIIACEKALAINHCDPLAWNIKGFVLFANGQYDEAIIALDKAIHFEQKFTTPWKNKCEVLKKLERINDLTATIEEAKKIAPQNESFQKYLHNLTVSLPKTDMPKSCFPSKNSTCKAKTSVISESLNRFSTKKPSADLEIPKSSASSRYSIDFLYTDTTQESSSVPGIVIEKTETGGSNCVKSTDQNLSESRINTPIKCIIFDLDQTLVDTSQLSRFRYNGDWNSVFSSIKTLKNNLSIDYLLSHLKTKGIKIGCITNAPRDYAIKIIQHFHWSIDVVISYNDTIKHKPDPEPFIKALSDLHIQPYECVAVGDEPNDAIAAKAAGINPISVGWFGQNKNILGSSESEFYQTIGEFTKYCETIPIQKNNNENSKSTSPDKISSTSARLKTSIQPEQKSRLFSPIFKNYETESNKNNRSVNTLGNYYSFNNPKQDDFSGNIWLLKIIDDHNEKGTPLKDPELMRKQIEDFSASIISLLNPDPDLVICVLPKSSKIREPGGIRQVAEKMCEGNFIDGTKVIERIKDRRPYHLGGDRDYATELASLGITNTELIKGKVILLLDDVTTTGNSFEAAKTLLLSHGAKQIVPFAIGRTSN